MVATKIITPFEDKLLRVVRGVVGIAPLEPALAIIAERNARPRALSRAAVELVTESLTRGCVLFLSRGGGWRRERFLRDGRPREGRLWERTAPADMPLRFSRRSMELFLWLTAEHVAAAATACAATDAEFLPADRLLRLLCYDALRDTEFAPSLRHRTDFAANGLIRFAFADDWTRSNIEPDMGTWFEGLGAVVLEALAPWLTRRWLAMEQRKGQIGDWKTLAAVGREQDRVLTAFTAAAESAGRLDLARFQLDVAAGLLPEGARADQYYGGLQGAGPMRLAERTEVLRRAVALPRHLLHLQRLERKARSVGYLDDGYPAAQLWLSDWENLNGETLAARAQQLIDQIEPIRIGA